MTRLPHARRAVTALSLTLTLIAAVLLGGAFPATANAAAPTLTVTEVVGDL